MFERMKLYLRKVASEGINHHVEHCIFVPASRVLFSSRCPTFRVSLLSSCLTMGALVDRYALPNYSNEEEQTFLYSHLSSNHDSPRLLRFFHCHPPVLASVLPVSFNTEPTPPNPRPEPPVSHPPPRFKAAMSSAKFAAFLQSMGTRAWRGRTLFAASSAERSSLCSGHRSCVPELRWL